MVKLLESKPFNFGGKINYRIVAFSKRNMRGAYTDSPHYFKNDSEAIKTAKDKLLNHGEYEGTRIDYSIRVDKYIGWHMGKDGNKWADIQEDIFHLNYN